MRWLNSVCDRFRPRRWYLPGFCNRDDLQGSSFINASKETYWFSSKNEIGILRSDGTTFFSHRSVCFFKTRDAEVRFIVLRFL
jgi:hypothetical protein